MSFEMDLVYGVFYTPCSNLIKFLYKSSAFIFDHNSFINSHRSNELKFLQRVPLLFLIIIVFITNYICYIIHQ